MNHLAVSDSLGILKKVVSASRYVSPGLHPELLPGVDSPTAGHWVSGPCGAALSRARGAVVGLRARCRQAPPRLARPHPASRPRPLLSAGAALRFHWPALEEDERY